jgi:hypothetical protein
MAPALQAMDLLAKLRKTKLNWELVLRLRYSRNSG